MFKKSFVALVATFAMASAMAGTPTAVKNATGNIVYGTEQLLSIEKDTSAGNRVKARYASGVQYVADDAAWSVFAKLQAGLVKPVAASTGVVYDISKSNGIYCSGSNSVVAFPNVGQPDYIADNCAFHQAALQNAQ